MVNEFNGGRGIDEYYEYPERCYHPQLEHCRYDVGGQRYSKPC